MSLHRELRLDCVTVDTSVMDFVVKAIAEKLAGLGGRPALRGAGRKRMARRVECPREHSGRNRGGKPDILLSAFEQVATSCVACAAGNSARAGRHLSVPTASSFSLRTGPGSVS